MYQNVLPVKHVLFCDKTLFCVFNVVMACQCETYQLESLENQTNLLCTRVRVCVCVCNV